MKIIYEIYTSPLSGIESIKATLENGHTLYIPIDPTNSDYQAYLRWLNGEPEPTPIITGEIHE